MESQADRESLMEEPEPDAMEEDGPPDATGGFNSPITDTRKFTREQVDLIIEQMKEICLSLPDGEVPAGKHEKGAKKDAYNSPYTQMRSALKEMK